MSKAFPGAPWPSPEDAPKPIPRHPAARRRHNFLPLTAALAATVDVPVPYLAVPAALAASRVFVMPVATAPNAIAYGSGS